MKQITCALLMLVCVTGCDLKMQIDTDGLLGNVDLPHQSIRPDVNYPKYERELPTVNLEQVFRQKNWIGSEREGSCVHATMIMLFRWQGRVDLAAKWRKTYENGEWPEGLAAKFDKEGVRYAYTSAANDVHFLEWACHSRRGCGVTVNGGSHMVMLVHLDNERAGIIDNNHPNEVKWVARRTFLSEWFNSNSWAVTPVYIPPPPLPYKEQNQ